MINHIKLRKCVTNLNLIRKRIIEIHLQDIITTSPSMSYFIHKIFFCSSKLLSLKYYFTTTSSLNPRDQSTLFVSFLHWKIFLEEWKLILKTMSLVRLDEFYNCCRVNCAMNSIGWTILVNNDVNSTNSYYSYLDFQGNNIDSSFQQVLFGSKLDKTNWN